MCLAYPGKIVEIKEDKAVIDYESEKRTALLPEKGYTIGDYVIVQGKIVIQKVPKEEALQSIKLMKENL